MKPMMAGFRMLQTLLIGSALILTSCSTEKKTETAPESMKPAEQTIQRAEETAPPPESLPESLSESLPAPAETTVESTIPAAEALTEKAQLEAAPGPPVEATPGFIVTEELYKKTFTEIESVVAAIDRIIKEQRYAEWVNFLTMEYTSKKGSADFLAEVSRSARLKNSKIVLHSLKDYFLQVVVPSRLEAKLEKLSFIDQNHVKALTTIQGSAVMLYYLVWEDENWKIGNW